MSYAYYYLAEDRLAQQECGEAIRSLKESEKYYEVALEMARKYSNLKSMSSSNVL